MSKPWDKLRVQPKQNPKPDPIGVGEWAAMCIANHNARVALLELTAGTAKLRIDHMCFGPAGLRELAEFCTELADQLEQP